MTFQLDTIGYVLMGIRKMVQGTNQLRFSDLSPFTQGYIEALFASSWRETGTAIYYAEDQREWRDARFSDIAPEALTRIIADCEAFQASPAHDHGGDRKAKGAALWKARNAVPDLGTSRYRFPPLTVQLGDDGKVRFA